MSEEALADERLRPLMFSIAYRMVGSVTEAEDIVQDAYLRMNSVDGAEIERPDAYATTVTTRLAIDHLRSARVRRESYVGPWLPEPLVGEQHQPDRVGEDPALRAERGDTVSMAFLVLLESLSPVERAVFLLREVFEYDYADIAIIVQRSQPNCRQIFVRARERVADREPRFDASAHRRAELAKRFLAACESGDLTALERLLAVDVTFHGDGGGKAAAVKRPVMGRGQVTRFLLGITRQAERWRLRIVPAQVNGQPGACAYRPDGSVFSAMSIDIVEGRVETIRNVLNPDKLRHLGPTGC